MDGDVRLRTLPPTQNPYIKGYAMELQNKRLEGRVPPSAFRGAIDGGLR
jgi:hypothetical protein